MGNIFSYFYEKLMKGESDLFKLKDMGNLKSLPEIALHIYEGNVDILRQALERGGISMNK